MTETPSTPENEPALPPPGDPDGVTSPYPAVDTVDTTAPRSGASRGVIIGIGAAVLAVIAGAGIYATAALSGGGRQPDELAPASTFAYAKVDLDPAANQKLAAREFFGKFPKLKKPTNGDSVFDSLLEQMFQDQEDVDYKTDVKPWFDKRAAVAAFTSSGEPAVVGILQSKDDGKARVALDKVKAKAEGDFAYRIEKGYVVIGDEQKQVDDAIAQADKKSLKDDATYGKDVDRLDGDQVVVGWVDVRGAFNAVKSSIPDIGLVPNALTDKLTGRFVSGVHLTGDYVEMSGFLLGAQQTSAPPPANEPKLLKDLPATTVAAISANGLGQQVKDALSQLGSFGDPDELLANLFPDDSGMSFDDILPLLGDQTVLSLGSVPETFEDLAVALVSTVKDPGTAKTNGDKLAGALSQMGVDVTADTSGSTFYLSTSDYLSEVKNNHGLGDVEKFKKAVGDTGSVVAAAYVDLESIIKVMGSSGEDVSDVQAMKSVGIVSGYDKGVPFFRARLVAL
jgi:hypothetical protein